MINVACGLINYNDKYLITQRSKNKKEYPLYWEFPGGKCDKDESIENCLKRELKEELNLDIEFNNIIYIKNNVVNKYNVHFCSCNAISFNIKINKEIEVYKIVSKNELSSYKFIPGDFDFIKSFLK